MIKHIRGNTYYCSDCYKSLYFSPGMCYDYRDIINNSTVTKSSCAIYIWQGREELLEYLKTSKTIKLTFNNLKE